MRWYYDPQDNRSGQGIPSDEEFHTYASVNVPAGTYLVLASGLIDSEQNVDSSTSVYCDAGGDHISVTDATLNEVDEIPFALTGVQTLASAGVLPLRCMASEGANGVGIAAAEIVAVKLG